MLGHADDQDIEECDVSISPDKYLAQHYPNIKIKQEPVSPTSSNQLYINRKQDVSPDRILTQLSISRSNVKSETSFDSGYFSPAAKQGGKMDDFPPLLQISPLKIENEMTLSPFSKGGIMDEMCSKPLYDDVNISDGWGSDFFSNFEENFLNMDFDEQTIDGILKSPKGKVALNEMLNSPKGKAIMQSPKGKVLKERLKYLDSAGKTKIHSVSQSVNTLVVSDPNKMSATPIKPDLNSAHKLSKRRLSMSSECKENSPVKLTVSRNLYMPKKQRTESPDIQQQQEVKWPETERLKFARDQFKLTLDRAVQNLSNQQILEEKHQNRRKAKGKSFKYPELSQALSRSSATSVREVVTKPFSAARRKNTTLSFVPLSSFVDMDEEDEDEDWDGDIPFTQNQKRKKRKTNRTNQANKKYRK